jgi:hypothetical protein
MLPEEKYVEFGNLSNSWNFFQTFFLHVNVNKFNLPLPMAEFPYLKVFKALVEQRHIFTTTVFYKKQSF